MIMVKNKDSSFFNYWDVNNLYGGEMSQELSVNDFEQIEETSQFNKDFIKTTIMKRVMKGIFLKLIFNT